jgi:flagellar assembly factor FliW
MLVLTTITVPSDLSKMSVNLKAPIVINVDTRKALQVVLEDDMPVKFFVYEILKSRKENAAKEKKD